MEETSKELISWEICSERTRRDWREGKVNGGELLAHQNDFKDQQGLENLIARKESIDFSNSLLGRWAIQDYYGPLAYWEQFPLSIVLSLQISQLIRKVEMICNLEKKLEQLKNQLRTFDKKFDRLKQRLVRIAIWWQSNWQRRQFHIILTFRYVWPKLHTIMLLNSLELN